MTHARPLSVSALSTIERCPRLWVAERIEGADSGSRWTRIGNACHAAADRITGAVVAGTARPLQEIAREAVLDFAAETNLAPDEMHEALDVMDNATAPGSSVTWGLRAGWTARAEASLALDESFQPCEAPGAYMGRIDRLQWDTESPSVEAWDWKSGHDWMSAEDVLADSQAQWYALLTLAFFPGAVVVTFRRVMLRLGYTASVTFVRGEPWEARIRDRMQRGRAAMLALLAAPETARETPGPWCKWCPRAGKCLALYAVTARGSELSIELSRDERARHYLALRAAADRLEESIRADVAAAGPIPLGDGTEIGMHPRRRDALRLDRDAIIARLRNLGMDAERERRLFAPSDAALPKIVKTALDELVPNKAARSMYLEEFLGSATSFAFDVRGVRE